MTIIDVKRLKLAMKAGQGVIDHLPDLPKRVPRGDAILKIDTAVQRPARLVGPTRHHSRLCSAKIESCSSNSVESQLFQPPARFRTH